jgi:hypothetical protein
MSKINNGGVSSRVSCAMEPAAPEEPADHLCRSHRTPGPAGRCGITMPPAFGRRRPGTDAERGPQRLTLRNRQPLEVIQHRRQGT